jgi:deoxyribodipyrimidine photo-lyase
MPVTDDLRIHAGREPGPRPGGELVLYWIQTTHRAHDNPALDFAVEQANALGLPLLVYHGLRPDYPWASDRLHTFILESVADLYWEFEARGIQYAFYLERARTPGAASPLVALADRAAVVVTDWFPTFIVPRQVRALRELTETPVIAVDGCTIVPLRYHEKEYVSAAAFRPRIMAALPHFLDRGPELEPRVRRRVELPFEPTVPSPEPPGVTPSDARGPNPGTSIPRLVASCDIDHSVPPSPLLRGGPAAARERLRRFLASGLPRYAEERGDPNAGATSMLSPYLHFGNLSAREVLVAAREAGPAVHYAKYEDELVTWRELSFNFVQWNRRHRTVDAIPAWAREELRRGEADPRPVLYGEAELEEGRTGEELWNAAQRAYLRDGWMHNALRMLWGKAVLQWTPNAAEALRILEHLNNKYALDGRDPNSYSGIHWIFGKFDRPFYRRAIYGTVRYQSLKAARDKFDVPAYLRRYTSGP